MLHAHIVDRSLGNRPLLADFLLSKADNVGIRQAERPEGSELGADCTTALGWWDFCQVPVGSEHKSISNIVDTAEPGIPTTWMETP